MNVREINKTTHHNDPKAEEIFVDRLARILLAQIDEEEKNNYEEKDSQREQKI